MANLKHIIGDRNPSMYGILDGYCKGKHWSCKQYGVDLDVLYSYCVGGCGVVGNIPDKKEEIARAFFEGVFGFLRRENINKFEFSTEDEHLSKQILSIFSEKIVYSEQKYSFRRTAEFDFEITIPGFEFLEVDLVVLNQLKDYKNNEMLAIRIDESWYSIEDFLNYSNAFVAVSGKEIVGVIFGSARFQSVVGVDIEVLEEYRNRGIAKGLTTNFVNACIRKGCIVQWDCVESDIVSRRIAEECGFCRFKKRPLYWFAI